MSTEWPWLHGSYTSYQRGCRCVSCREATNEYHRQARRRDVPYAVRNRMRMKVRDRAMRRLAKEYPERFHALILEEGQRLADEGLLQ